MAKTKYRTRKCTKIKDNSNANINKTKSDPDVNNIKCKRGKKLCKECSHLNPINCKNCQSCGHEFFRKQSKTILKQLAKAGNEYYAYLDTISYAHGDNK